jgi:hypothetical protein
MHPTKQRHTWQCHQLIDTTPRGPSSAVTSAKSNGIRLGRGDPILLKMRPIGCPERQKRITTLRSVISQKSEDLIYIGAEARNRARLHSSGDKLLETSFLLHLMPGIPVSIFFQRVAAYILTEVICEFPLSLETDHTHLNLSFTTSFPILCHVHIRESVV